MPVSHQERHRLRKEAKATKASVQTYIITDEHFRPDMHGGIGGVKTFSKNGKHCLVLNEQQARYWLDQGMIAPEAEPEQEKK